MELTLQCSTISMISPLFKMELLKWTSYALTMFFSWMFTFVLGNRKWIKSVHFLNLILLHCFTVLFLLFLNKKFFVILYCHRIHSLSFYLKQMHLENCNIRIKKNIKKKLGMRLQVCLGTIFVVTWLLYCDFRVECVQCSGYKWYLQSVLHLNPGSVTFRLYDFAEVS